MAEIVVYLAGSSLWFDSGGGAWPDALINHGFTNDIGGVAAFNATTDQESNRIYGAKKIPLLGLTPSAAVVEFSWTGQTAGTNTVNWVFRYKVVNKDAASLDIDLSASADETEDWAAAMDANAEYSCAESQTLTHGNLTDGYILLWDLCRDGDDGTNDTYADEALLLLDTLILRITAS